jgi:hypothetical protein
MTKLFNLVKVKKGSTQPLSPPQKTKFVRFKLVNDGKFNDFGKYVGV